MGVDGIRQATTQKGQDLTKSSSRALPHPKAGAPYGTATARATDLQSGKSRDSRQHGRQIVFLSALILLDAGSEIPVTPHAPDRRIAFQARSEVPVWPEKADQKLPGRASIADSIRAASDFHLGGQLPWQLQHGRHTALGAMQKRNGPASSDCPASSDGCPRLPVGEPPTP